MLHRIALSTATLAAVVIILSGAPSPAHAPPVIIDLTVTAVTVTPTSPLAGSGTLSATILNQGNSLLPATPEVHVGFYLDTVRCATEILGAVGVDESVLVSTQACSPTFSGSHVIQVIADTEGAAAEQEGVGAARSKRRAARELRQAVRRKRCRVRRRAVRGLDDGVRVHVAIYHVRRAGDSDRGTHPPSTPSTATRAASDGEPRYTCASRAPMRPGKLRFVVEKRTERSLARKP